MRKIFLLLPFLLPTYLFSQSWSTNISANGLSLGRYGYALSGDANPYTVYTTDSELHDLIFFGGSAATLNLRLYDGDLKLGYNATPNSILYNNGNAFFGGNVGVGTLTPEGKLTINQIGNGWNDGLRINRDATNYLTLTEDVSDIRLKNWGPGGILFFTSTAQPLTILNGGNIGVGTASPGGLLEIKGPYSGNSQVIINTTNTSGELRFSDNDVPKGFVWYSQGGNYMAFGRGSTSNSMFVNGSGDFGIGTTAPDSKLSVKGTIHSQEVKVDLNGAVAPDYVFEKDYPLTSLSDLKLYIDQNKHLPEVPSAKEMEENGINLKKMNLMLLKKIEELTLHLLDQNERIGAQEAETSALKSELKNRICNHKKVRQ